MGLCGAKGTRALTLANSAHPMWAWSGESAVCRGHLPGGATCLVEPPRHSCWVGPYLQLCGLAEKSQALRLASMEN